MTPNNQDCKRTMGSKNFWCDKSSVLPKIFGQIQEGCALSALQMRASHAESDVVLMNHSESRKCRDFRVACHTRIAGYDVGLDDFYKWTYDL